MEKTYRGSVKHFWNLSQKWRSSNDQIWAKRQFWSYHFIFNVPGTNFCQMKTLIEVMLSIAENLRSKVRDKGHQTDDHIWAKLQFWCCHSNLMYQVAHIFENTNWGSVKHFWKFGVHGSKVKVTRWLDMGKSSDLEPYAHYTGGFWRPICDLGILSPLAGRGIPTTIQHWLLSSMMYIFMVSYFK